MYNKTEFINKSLIITVTADAINAPVPFNFNENGVEPCVGVLLTPLHSLHTFYHVQMICIRAVSMKCIIKLLKKNIYNHSMPSTIDPLCQCNPLLSLHNKYDTNQ